MKRIWRHLILLLALLGAVTLPAAAELWPAPGSIGFSVSVPYALPLDWNASFSCLSAEALINPNMTLLFGIGTYPVSFPDLFEADASLLVKGWLGPVAVYGGGGLSMQYRRVGEAWALRPLLASRAGIQIWIVDSLAFSLQFRSLDPFPLTWTLNPEIALGINVGIGRARPEGLQIDGDYLWFLVGLGVAALIAFLPRQ
jgi:hypothetical protein